MPVPDPRTGNICIWLVSCFFFVALTTGGIFLVLYIAHPSAESSLWFPVAGVVLVALPWLFWVLTCVYRCISRACFGRGLGVAGGGIQPRNGANGNVVNSGQMPRTASGLKNSMEDLTELQVEFPGGDGRRVRFGATVVVDASNGGVSSGRGDDNGDGDDDDPRILDSLGVSNGAYDDTSFASHESEMPLASSRS